MQNKYNTDSPELNPSLTPADIPIALLLAIALLQGLVLLVLYRLIEQQHWIAQQPMLLSPMLSISLLLPTGLMLALTPQHGRTFWFYLSLYALAILACSLYLGWQSTPTEYIHSGGLWFIFAASLLIASFKALMYIQSSQRGTVEYLWLFKYSWRNLLCLGLGIAFTGILFGIFRLWAKLFSIIGIDIFSTLLEKDFFIIPVAALSLASTIILLRLKSQILDTIAQLLQTLSRALLPLIVLLFCAFLITLAFVGLELLWDSSFSGTSLLIAVQLLSLFAINAVYQHEAQDRPYPLLLHRLLYAGISLLPLVAVLASYGIYLRIEQHGLSVARCWVLFIECFLALYTLAYLIIIFRYRDQWTDYKGGINKALGLLLMLALFVVNTPLLDFKKLSISSQLTRLERGAITPDKFDVEYLNSLARPGYLTALELKDRYADNTELQTRLERVLTPRKIFTEEHEPMNFNRFKKELVIRPSTVVIPKPVYEYAYLLLENEHGVLFNDPEQKLFLIPANLHESMLHEHMLFILDKYMLKAYLIYFDPSVDGSVEDQWQSNKWFSNIHFSDISKKDATPSYTQYKTMLETGTISVTPSAWQTLHIDELVIEPDFREF